LQVLSDGLRDNQTIAELNLSGCKISDEGIKVLAGVIKVTSILWAPSCMRAQTSTRFD